MTTVLDGTHAPNRFRQFSKDMLILEFANWIRDTDVKWPYLPTGTWLKQNQDRTFELAVRSMCGEVYFAKGDWCLIFDDGVVRLTDEQMHDLFPQLIQKDQSNAYQKEKR